MLRIGTASLERAMRISTIAASMMTALLCAAAFWADGSNLGSILIASAIAGWVVFFQGRTVEGGWLQASIATVYLSSIALASVSASLIDKALSSTASANLLQVSTVGPGVLLGWTICVCFLRRDGAPQ